MRIRGRDYHDTQEHALLYFPCLAFLSTTGAAATGAGAGAAEAAAGAGAAAAAGVAGALAPLEPGCLFPIAFESELPHCPNAEKRRKRVG